MQHPIIKQSLQCSILGPLLFIIYINDLFRACGGRVGRALDGRPDGPGFKSRCGNLFASELWQFRNVRRAFVFSFSHMILPLLLHFHLYISGRCCFDGSYSVHQPIPVLDILLPSSPWSFAVSLTFHLPF